MTLAGPDLLKRVTATPPPSDRQSRAPPAISSCGPLSTRYEASMLPCSTYLVITMLSAKSLDVARNPPFTLMNPRGCANEVEVETEIARTAKTVMSVDRTTVAPWTYSPTAVNAWSTDLKAALDAP